MVLAFLVFEQGHDKYPATGADGVKIAVFRKGRANLVFIRAAAHRKRYIAMISQMRAPKKGKIGLLVPLLFLLLLSFSCGSNKIDQNYCDRLSEIKTMPLKGVPVEDDVYNGLMKMGDLAVPCLVDQLTNVTKTPDPRRTPIYSETTLGDVALFVLLDITKVPVEDVFPKEIINKWEDQGIYAYFAFVEKEVNRRVIQDRWRNWYRNHKAG